ncbi:DUF5706 domain-containing protein [Flavobacterium agricola]|uniref:DUF5706 domain-containing protein n=1 Tax=Flavobacterium agricola TaxID=2870839 RepID=A0ABY6M118_9FLAO|nr:Pycsar system effector family protein [Flavobacterium agricola]UYW02216.1 DUF5706 domain-containing protein [Flavobacterium agricola]
MNYQEIIANIAQYVQDVFAKNQDETLVYHNINHTLNVVQAAEQIGNHYQLNETDFFVLRAASWFHDIGYYFGGKNNHEQVSAEKAASYLTNLNVSTNLITQVSNCIKATKMPQQPNNLLEQIICDADLFHLGTDEFSICNKLVRDENTALSAFTPTKKEWHKCSIAFLAGHQYHTDYCKQLLNAKKQQNIEKLIAKLDDKPKEKTAADKPKEKNTTDKSNKETARGVETLFRVTSTNNQRLSDMADNKAQILITVNSIILSVIISLLLRKLDNNTYLIVPTFLILIVSVVTMVVSILATRPSIPPGVFSQKDIEAKKVNLLFFGNFYKMTRDEYADGMWKVMEDRTFLYGTLIDDVYSQGVVLGRKYKLLRLAYNIFMYGIIVSVIGFVISVISVQ